MPEAQFVPGLIHLVATTMGDMLEPQGLCPERYLVKGFPSDEKMAVMQPAIDLGTSVASRRWTWP